jgi:hypothetical protein
MPEKSLTRFACPTVVDAILLCTLVVSPSKSSAQLSRDARVNLVLAGGIARLPDALSRQCGTAINSAGTDSGPEIGAGFLFRPLRWMVVLADTRMATRFPFPSGCYVIGPPVDTNFSRQVGLFATSTLRVGVETPLAPGAPLVRLTAGSGLVLGAPLLPLTVLTAGLSSGGEGKRFLVEIERAQTRLRATETYNFATPSFTQPIVLHPVVHTVRAGVEIPLRSPP